MGMKNIKTIYFMDNGYGVRGGADLFIRIIMYLLKNTNISVGLIDFKDGYMTEKLKDNDNNIKFINYEDSCWDIEADSVILTSTDKLVLLKPIKDEKAASTIKILSIIWESKIAWKILYSTSILKKFAKLMAEKNSLIFIDYGCLCAVEEQLNRKYTPAFFPVYFNNENKCISASPEIIKNNEINIGWLGRLSNTKSWSLINLIKQLNIYKTEAKKIIHIIGNGPYKDDFLKILNSIKDLKVEIKFLGVLTGKALDDYLLQNVDILFAMGTSMLNGASIKIPVAGVCETGNPNCNFDRFIWLFKEKGMQLGLPDNFDALKKQAPDAVPIKEILDAIYIFNQKQEIGQKCYQYYIENHNNIKNSISILFDSINRSQLFYSDLKDLYKELPFVNQFQTDIKFRNTTIISARKINNVVSYYFLGIKFLEKVYFGMNDSRRYRPFGLFTLIKIENIGMFGFPSIFDKSLKDSKKNEEKDIIKQTEQDKSGTP